MIMREENKEQYEKEQYEKIANEMYRYFTDIEDFIGESSIGVSIEDDIPVIIGLLRDKLKKGFGVDIKDLM